MSDTDPKILSVREYFKKVDMGDPAYLQLFSDEVDFFFPKFGRTQGKAGLIRFAQHIGATLRSIQHDIANFRYIVAGNTVVVEGCESGIMADGTRWPDGRISEGRFCSVFEFQGELIGRMYIYVDPDYPSTDVGRAMALRGRVKRAG